VRTLLRILPFLALAVAACAPARAGELTLSWDHAAPQTVTEFRVYERVGADWVQVKAIAGTQQTVQLTNVAPGVRTYRVTAANEAGESAPSNEASGGIPPDAPYNFRVVVEVTVRVAAPSSSP
jgi:hypothetical protein